MRAVLALLLFVSGLAFAEEPARVDIPEHLAAEYAQMQKASVAAVDGQCGESIAILPAVVDGPTFTEYPEEVQRTVLQIVLNCALRANDRAKSISLIYRLLEYEGVDRRNLLEALLTIGTAERRPTVGADGVIGLAEHDPTMLSVIDAQLLYELYAQILASTLGEEFRYRFLHALYNSGYTPPNPFHSADEFFVDYAAMAIDRGDPELARKVVLELNDPGMLVRVRIDRRFDLIRQDGSLEDFLDLEAAAQREIERLRVLVEQHPKMALGYLQYAKALAGANRFQEALDVIEPVAWKIRTPIINRMYVDVDASKGWVLREYSTALERLKYPEQAGAMWTEAVVDPDLVDPADFVLDETNGPHAIDLANRAFWAGAFDFALGFTLMLDEAGATPYGEMFVKAINVCANAMKKPPGDYMPALNYLVEHERENPGAMIQAYLCLDDLDAAAAYSKLRLARPDQRANALLSLQYMDREKEIQRLSHEHSPSDDLTPGHLMWDRYAALKARDDVQAAVEKVGRFDEIPLDSSVWHRY